MESAKNKWLAFSALGIGLFSAVLDGSMIGIALPQIGQRFSVDLSQVAWLSLVSTITIVGILLPIGNISDRIGRKKIYLAGVLIMALFSILSAISQNFTFLLFTRVFVSVGAAMRMSSGLAMVMMIFGDKERGTGMGANTTTVGLAAISGPIFGGILVSNFGWTSVFIIQAILSVPVFFMALYLLDEKVVDGSRRRSSGKFDYLGTLFSAAAFAVLLFSINTGIRIFNGITIVLCFLSVAALFISFFYVESRSENPILDLSLIRNKDFVLSISTRLFGFFAGSSLFFLMPFYIQLIKGRTPEEAGFLIFPGALGMSLTASVSGRLSDRFGQKPFIISGLSVILVASYLFSRFTPSTPNIIIVATLIFHGLGMGLWGSPNGSQTVSLVPRHLYGSVSSIINLIRTVGMGVSIAVASSIITISFAASGIEPNFSREVGSAFSPEKIEAFMNGFRTTFMMLLIICLIAILSAVFSRSGDPESLG